VFFSVAGDTNEQSLVQGSTAGGAETVLMKSDVPPYDYLNPMWSPDGSRILTAKWDLSVGIKLWSIKIKNGRREGEPKSKSLGNLPLHGKPAWLNNSDSIAVSASAEGVTQLVQTRVEGFGGPLEMLSLNNEGFGDLDSITCSPEFFHNKCQQELIATKHDDRSQVLVTTLNEDQAHEIPDQGTFTGISWKDDHTLVSQREYGGHLALSAFNADGPPRFDPVVNEKHRVKDPAVTPDGRYLIYSSNQSNGIHLWRIDLKDKNAEPLQLTFGSSVEYQPAISPDGQWIIFTSITHGFETLWRMNINEKVPRQIGKQTARNGSVTVDGRIVCECLLRSGTDWKWRIAILDQDGQLRQEFRDIPIGTPVKWSPDGKSIFYVKEENGTENVWKKSIQDGGPGTRVTQFGEERIFAFALSPDGSRIACLCGHEEAQILRMQLRAK
jgi:WD40 repeat protein